MSHEFNDAELCMCDGCREFFPADEMYQLTDMHMVCEDCYSEGWEDNNDD